jgi:predicted metal-dependent hydrolase
MDNPQAGSSGLLAEIRDFLSGFKRDLPELFAPPPVSGGGRERARAVFQERVAHWSVRMGVAPNRIFIKEQRSLWGSCSTKGNLNFNARLLEAPPEVLDYVVVHELSHLKEMNHSRRFWAVVQSWCPRHKEHRRWLRENSRLLRSATAPAS